MKTLKREKLSLIVLCISFKSLFSCRENENYKERKKRPGNEASVKSYITLGFNDLTDLLYFYIKINTYFIFHSFVLCEKFSCISNAYIYTHNIHYVAILICNIEPKLYKMWAS